MAEVYLAHDQLLNRPVALKALFPEYAREPSFVERFRREAQAAANLNHPNIVAIYDWGQEAGTYFIVMEYVEGRSLRDLIRSEAPRRSEPGRRDHRRDRVGARVRAPQRRRAPRREAGQRAAHADGHREGHRLRHRARGRERRAHPDRFGDGHRHVLLARAGAGPPGRRPQRRVRARRRALRDGHRRRAVHRRLAGRRSRTSTCAKTPVPPSQRNPDVPPDLEQIILTALAKDPDHRYQTADDMRADLLRFRRGRPLAAAPVTALVAEVPTTATARRPRRAYARDRWRHRASTTAAARSAGPRIRAQAQEHRARHDPHAARRSPRSSARSCSPRSSSARSEGHVTVPERRRARTSTIAQAELQRRCTSNPTSQRVISSQAGRHRDRPDRRRPARASRANTTVNLTVSSGLEQVHDPVRHHEQAGRRPRPTSCTALGFVVGPQQTRRATTVDKGTRDRQQPAAGFERGARLDRHADRVDRARAASPIPERAAARRRIEAIGRPLRTSDRGFSNDRDPARVERAPIADAVSVDRARCPAATATQGGRRRRDRSRLASSRRGPVDPTTTTDRHRSADHDDDRRRCRPRSPTTTTHGAVTLRRAWYREHGRHDLPWRASRDRWTVLVSEVMLHQTQVPRVVPAYDGVHGAVPDAGRGRRGGTGRGDRSSGAGSATRGARAGCGKPPIEIARDGWPDDLAELPGVGRYTAAAIAAQVDDADRDRHRGEHPPRVRARARRTADRPRRRGARPSRSRRACTDATGCSR